MLILQSRPRKTPKHVWLKRLGWSLIPIAIVIAWLSYEPALAHYHLWKQARALKQAKQFIAQHDPDDAQLALEVAFTVAPNNIEAWRTAADMLEQVGSPQAMKIRYRLVQMQGANLNDQAALINCDIRFHDFNAARDALERIPAGPGRTSPRRWARPSPSPSRPRTPRSRMRCSTASRRSRRTTRTSRSGRRCCICATPIPSRPGRPAANCEHGRRQSEVCPARRSAS